MTPETLDVLAVRVAQHIARAGDEATLVLARAHADIVAAFVHGYTRGRGFNVLTGDPAPDLQAVIVAATARLTTNPEQVTAYTAADYSERPAVFEGWTHAELGVLHVYRARWA